MVAMHKKKLIKGRSIGMAIPCENPFCVICAQNVMEDFSHLFLTCEWLTTIRRGRCSIGQGYICHKLRQ